jgi:hypothetical protein
MAIDLSPRAGRSNAGGWANDLAEPRAFINGRDGLCGPDGPNGPERQREGIEIEIAIEIEIGTRIEP